MNTDESQVLDEGNCSRATGCGEEARGCMGKRRVCRLLKPGPSWKTRPSFGTGPHSPLGCIFVKAARLRTETSYKAGTLRRAGTTRAKPFQTTVQVNDELAQRSITLLSGEICIAWSRPSVAPASRACPKPWNGSVQADPGGAEVSRGRSTELPRPTETGRTKR